MECPIFIEFHDVNQKKMENKKLIIVVVYRLKYEMTTPVLFDMYAQRGEMNCVQESESAENAITKDTTAKKRANIQ